MAQGTEAASAGRPHNSSLMKLAMRPSISPIGPTAQVMSPSDSAEMPRQRANSSTASTQPMKPPWNDMPPCQICTISSGCAMK